MQLIDHATMLGAFELLLRLVCGLDFGLDLGLPGLSRPALVRTSRLAERCLANSRCCGSHCHCGTWWSEDLEAASKQP